MSGDVAVGFFRHGTEILLVSRDDPESGRRDAVSVRAGTTEEADRRRLVSAVGDADSASLVRGAEPVDLGGGADTARQSVRPYLFESGTRELTLGDSVTAHEWVQPPELLARETTSGLWKAYLAVAPSVETVRGDAEHGAEYVSLRALEALRDRAADAAATGGDYESVAASARELRRARPSMGVVGTRIDRVMAAAERAPSSVRDRAIEACIDAVRAGEAAAERAASLLGDRVFTLSRSGTVRTALEAGTPGSVFVAESRPAREGIGVAERLAEAGFDVTVLVDAAIEGLLAEGGVDTVLVGADAVLADGRVVNKVGTRTAMRAGTAAAGIDCYAVCSRDKIVPGTDFDPEFGSPGAVYGGDADLAVHNPTFERTPPSVVSGIVTEDGVYAPEDVGPIADEHASYGEWER
jgi:translation initiation factor 2B subunit (eIF-2B alpha/beta/delta family)